MPELTCGAQAPNFRLEDIDGRSRCLEDALREGVVVLVFYHADCPTCEFAMPIVQKVYGDSGSEFRAQFWGISQDDAETTRSFAARAGLTFPILIDPEPYDISSAYKFEFVPAIFVVGSDGCIRWSDCGFSRDGIQRVADALGSREVVWEQNVPLRRPGCRAKS